MPATPPRAGGDEVHVWRVRLDRSSGQLANLYAALSEDERTRAARALSPAARRRFVTARAGLRIILAGYLGQPPAALTFEYGAQGKPELGGTPLQFNASHSHRLALIAVALGREIGVDLERVRDLPNAAALARRFFSPRERDVLERLEGGRRVSAFLAGWTRKEAYLKATGGGLGWGRALARVEVSLLPGEDARLLALDGDPAASADWTLAALRPGRGYVGALAYSGQGCRVLGWDAVF